MKNILFIFLLLVSENSCCNFSSKPCNCYFPQPVIDESAKQWISPFNSEKLIFNNKSFPSNELIIYRKYSEQLEEVGGDECVATYPSFVTNFELDTISHKLLLQIKALSSNVSFSSVISKYNGNNIGQFFSTKQDSFYCTDAFHCLETDTLLNGSKTKKLTFIKINKHNPISIFNDLSFLKGIGIIEFTDTFGIKWALK